MKRILCLVGMVLGTLGSLLCLGLGIGTIFLATEAREFIVELRDEVDRSIEQLRAKLAQTRNQVQQSRTVAERIGESFDQREPRPLAERLGQSPEITAKVEELALGVQKAKIGLDFAVYAGDFLEQAVELAQSSGVPISGETVSALVAEIRRIDTQLADAKETLEQLRNATDEGLPQRRERLRELVQQGVTTLKTIQTGLATFDEKLNAFQAELQDAEAVVLNWLRLAELIVAALFLWLVIAQSYVAWGSWKGLR